MKYSNTPYLFIILLIIAFTPSLATAHKINVFAYESNNTIYCEASFSGGRPAQNTTIEVVNADDQQLILKGTTDELGKFEFPIQQKMKNNNTNLTIIANSGDGHKNSWQLPAIDYIHSTKILQNGIITPPTTHKNSTSITTTQQPGNYEQIIESTVERVIQRELAPLKRALAQQQNTGPNAKDIFSGLGYIFGIAGLLVLIRSKKKGTDNA